MDSQSESDHTYYIIREVYENNSAVQRFENELDVAVDRGYKVIVIEPSHIGKETARWISIGRWLRYIAMTSAVSCLATGMMWPACGRVFIPFGCIGAVCAGVYVMSWQTDPCSCYRVEKNPLQLQRLPATASITSASPVILLYTDSFLHRYAHVIAVGVSCSYCVWKLICWWK